MVSTSYHTYQMYTFPFPLCWCQQLTIPIRCTRSLFHSVGVNSLPYLSDVHVPFSTLLVSTAYHTYQMYTFPFPLCWCQHLTIPIRCTHSLFHYVGVNILPYLSDVHIPFSTMLVSTSYHTYQIYMFPFPLCWCQHLTIPIRFTCSLFHSVGVNSLPYLSDLHIPFSTLLVSTSYHTYQMYTFPFPLCWCQQLTIPIRFTCSLFHSVGVNILPYLSDLHVPFSTLLVSTAYHTYQMYTFPFPLCWCQHLTIPIRFTCSLFHSVGVNSLPYLSDLHVPFSTLLVSTSCHTYQIYTFPFPLCWCQQLTIPIRCTHSLFHYVGVNILPYLSDLHVPFSTLLVSTSYHTYQMYMFPFPLCWCQQLTIPIRFTCSLFHSVGVNILPYLLDIHVPFSTLLVSTSYHTYHMNMFPFPLCWCQHLTIPIRFTCSLFHSVGVNILPYLSVVYTESCPGSFLHHICT